mmetsp:Transcript_18344/g.30744  ORF Transcript_18344/g.30744 Transcript_18344/m.30744 type:complete len:314 (+) Transcript_18344:120-1061(+)
MLDEDTPRSARSIGYGSPRDDRFYTPRTVARSNSYNSNSNSEEWQSPRFETPRYESPRIPGGTPRSQVGGTPRSDYSGEFQTPRAFDADRKVVDRREMYPPVHRSSSRSDYYPHGESPVMAAQSKKSFQPPTGSKDTPYTTNAQYYNNNMSPGFMKADSKSDGIVRGEYGGERGEEETVGQEGGGADYDHEQLALDLAASGLSEKDVEDVFSYARHGRCEEIDRLFNKGLPVDVRDTFGNTVLIIACQNGNKRVAKGVLRRGANINSRNLKGNTPLHYCYHYGYGETLGQYLISKGADAEARNNAGRAITQGI